MDEIIDYKILHGQGARNTECSVLNLISLGWQPLGAVTADGIGDVVQAMVRYRENSQNN